MDSTYSEAALLLSDFLFLSELCMTDNPTPRPPPSPAASITTRANTMIQKLRGVTPHTRLRSGALPWVYGIDSSGSGQVYASGAFGGTTSRSEEPLYP